MSLSFGLKIAIYIIGALALAALAWFGGPMISINDVRPFDPAWVRYMIIGTLFTGVFATIAWDVVRRWQASKELASGMSEPEQEDEGDGEVLSERMADALKTLRKTRGAKGDYLYDLPWYMLIGPPGSGKTTALVNSGLKFPLANGLTPEAVAGAGGTRYCDWWFTEDAVMIDTAGRYTTQDSNAKGDQKSWFAFLDLLKKHRPRQPINGVLVCISLEDLLSASPQELAAHSDAIRRRLTELHEHLKVDFPVYAVFTKADLVAGFMEFFAHLNDAGRRKVWGVTFQTDDKTLNMVGTVASQFDPLIERLNQELVDRLQEELTPSAKVQIFGFPSQINALKDPIVSFLTRIFEPSRYHSDAALRGFYFTSGTQQGTPIDQLIGALSRSFGAAEVGQQRLSGLGRSYFLTDLILKVIIGEAGWVSTNRSAVRRAWVLKAAAYTLLVMTCIGAAGAWTVSYFRNTDLIGNVFSSGVQYRSIAGSLRDETLVADAQLDKLLPPLQHLRMMPTGHTETPDSVPLAATFGLSQWGRLHSSSDTAYGNALNRMLRTRLMYRLEDLIRQNLATPALVTDTLGIYLMLSGRTTTDREAVLAWHRRDWSEELLRGPQYAPHRQALEQHLASMLAMPFPQGLNIVEPDEALIQDAQAAIARMSLADRAFQMIRADAATQSERDWVLARKGGQDVGRVFEAPAGRTLDELRVPFLFTYAGFHEVFLRRIPTVSERLRGELRLLGAAGSQSAVLQQYDALPASLLEIYGREFEAAWQQMFRQLRIRSLVADRPQYETLRAAAAATSPIRQILESIRDETGLTRERPPAPAPAGQAAPPPPAALEPLNFALAPGQLPGSRIQSQFRSFQLLFEGDRGRLPIDNLLRALADVETSLRMINNPAEAAQGNALIRQNLDSLRHVSRELPQPFSGMIQTAVNTFDTDATGTTVARLLQALSEQVTRVCQQAISGRYPFVRGSDRDMPLAEFQRVFGTSGVIDRFFQTQLAPMADTSRREWAWNPTNSIARQLSPQLLRQFQRAAEIRQAFFPGGAPGFTFAARNQALGNGVDLARLEVNGMTLTNERPPPPRQPGFFNFGQSPPPPPQVPAPVGAFQWPGPQGMSAVAVSVAPEFQGRLNRLQRDGTWAIFRMLEGASTSRQGEAVVVRFNVGGREVSYLLNVAGVSNPLIMLPALREFRCPTAQ